MFCLTLHPPNMKKWAYLPDASGMVDHDVKLGNNNSRTEFFEQRVVFTDQMFQIKSFHSR